MTAASRILRIGIGIVALLLLGAPTAHAAAKPTRAPADRVDSLTSSAGFAVVIGPRRIHQQALHRRPQGGSRPDPTNGDPFTFDVARTSDRGAWLAVRSLTDITPLAPFDSLTATVAKRKIHLSGGRVLICGKAAISPPLGS